MIEEFKNGWKISRAVLNLTHQPPHDNWAFTIGFMMPYILMMWVARFIIRMIDALLSSF